MAHRFQVLFILIIAAVVCTGCPQSFPPTELEGVWRAPDGAVLQMRSILAWVIATDPISYTQNNPPCSGYAYVWCKAGLTLRPEENPKQIDLVYPTLLNEEDGIAYCGTDPNTIGFNIMLDEGLLTQAQFNELNIHYELAMVANLQLSAKSWRGIYRIVDNNHIQIALSDPGDPRPSSFANAVTYTRDTRDYPHQTLASLCPG